MRTPVVLVRVLLSVLLVDDKLVLLLIVWVHSFPELLLREVENLGGLLGCQISLAEGDHLLEALRSEASSNQTRVQGLPCADVLFRAQPICQELLVSLCVELVQGELVFFFYVLVLVELLARTLAVATLGLQLLVFVLWIKAFYRLDIVRLAKLVVILV